MTRAGRAGYPVPVGAGWTLYGLGPDERRSRRPPDRPVDPDARPDEPPEPSAADIRTLRLQKLDRLRAEGETVYPYRFDRDRTLGELRAEFGSLDDGEETEVEVKVAGRLMLKREQGRLTFGVAARPRRRGAAVRLPGRARQGGVRRASTTSTGATGSGVDGHGDGHPQGRAVGQGHALRAAVARRCGPLPDKWKGLSDVDQRYRQRYVDLIVNEDARGHSDDPHRRGAGHP